MTHSRRLMLTTLLGAAFLPFQAIAEPADQAATLRSADVFGIAAVDSQDLAFSRGGAQLEFAFTKGEVRGNQASDLTTGNNHVSDGSFAGAIGFSTVVQNSGNNVLIQNATVITVKVQ